MNPRTVYLDHAATTPMAPAAIEAMTAELALVGNASSLHASGRRARRVLEESRERIAAALGSRPGEVVFTSGGTEADNLALKGAFWARRGQNPARTRILASTVEHHAVLDPLQWLESTEGAHVELVPCDATGLVDLAAMKEAIERDPASVAVISVMWANNEVGTLQPVTEIAELAAAHGIPVHTDAVQAVGAVPVDFATSGVDALSLTGHKLGGPVGAGALVVRRELELTALVHGGGQERDVRSGTHATAAIAGFAAAVELAVKEQEAYATRVGVLRDRLVEQVLSLVPNSHLNGPPLEPLGRQTTEVRSSGELARPLAPSEGVTARSADRLPSNAQIAFPGCEGDSLLMLLDAAGVECSTGAACSAGVPQASHVLLAMGQSDEQARSSLRFSLGHTTTTDDVDRLVAAIGPAVERGRAAGLQR